MHAKALRLIRRLLVLIILLGLLGLGFLVLFYNEPMLQSLKATFWEKIQAKTEYQIAWRDATIFPANRIVFHDLLVGDEEGEPILEAERVMVRYRLWDLLIRRVGVLESIQEVSLDGLYLHGEKILTALDNPAQIDGFDGLDGLEFRGKISIREGRGSFPIAERETEILDKITGYIDFQEFGFILLSLTGQVSSLPGSRLHLQGQGAPQMAMELSFDGIQAEGLLSSLEKILPTMDPAIREALEIRGGQIEGRIHLEGIEFTDLKYRGCLTIEDGEFTLLDFDADIAKLNANLTLEPHNIIIDNLAGRLMGVDFVAGGFLNPATKDGSVKVAFERLALADLNDALHRLALNFLPLEAWPDLAPTGEGYIEIKIIGSWQEPFVEGLVVFPRGCLAGSDFNDLVFDVRYQKNFLSLRNMAVSFGEGSMQARGSVRWLEGEPYFSLTTELTDVETALIPAEILMPDVIRGGTVNGNILLAGYDFDLKDVTVIGSICFNDATVLNFPFTKAEAGLWLSKGELLLSPFLVEDQGGGTLKASGTLNLAGDMDFFLDAANIDFSAYVPNLQGLGKFNGQVSGNIEKPIITGLVAGRDFFWYEKMLGNVDGQVNIDLGTKIWVFDNFKLDHPHGEATINGSLDLRGQEPRFAVEADMTGPSLRALVDCLDYRLPIDLDGELRGDINIAGLLSDPQVEGRLFLQKGTIEEQAYDSLQTAFDWYRGRIKMDSFEMAVAGGKVLGRGTVSQKGQLDLTGMIVGVHLADIAYVSNVLPDLQGKAAFDGKISGFISEPLIEGKISAYDLAWQESNLGELKGILNFNPRTVIFTDWQYVTKAGFYGLAGQMDIVADGDLDLHIVVNNGSWQDVSFLLADMEDWADSFAFSIDGEATILGKNSNPYISFAGSMQGADGEINTWGEGHRNGPFEISVEGNEFDISLFNDLAILPWQVEGRGDVALIASYDEGWQYSGANKVRDMKIDGFPIHDVCGTFLWGEGDSVRLDQEIKRKQDQLFVRGIIPFDPNTMGLDVQLEGQGVRLDFFPFFIKNVKYSQGIGDVVLTISGSQVDPRFYGQIDMAKGGFRYVDVPGTFSELTGSAKFYGNQLIFDNIGGAFNGTGRVEVKGYMLLSGWDFSYYDLVVNCNRIPLNHGSIKGTFDGRFTVLGPYFTPKVRGKAIASNTTVRMPYSWPLEGVYESGGPFRPQVAIILEPRSNVKVVEENYEAVIQSGEIQLDNNAGYFELVGELNSRQGRINYYSTNFRLTEGKARFLRFGQSFPHLAIKAQTRVGDTRIFLSVEGPALDMDFKLSSAPLRSEQEIIGLLASRGGLGHFLEGNLGGAIEDEFWRLLSETFHSSFLSRLEHSLEDVLRFDEISITPFLFSSEQQVQLHLGKAITNNIYLTYTQDFYSDRWERQFGVNLRLHEHIFLDGLFQSGSDFQLGIEFHFPFN